MYNRIGNMSKRMVIIIHQKKQYNFYILARLITSYRLIFQYAPQAQDHSNSPPYNPKYAADGPLPTSTRSNFDMCRLVEVGEPKRQKSPRLAGLSGSKRHNNPRLVEARRLWKQIPTISGGSM